MKGYCPECDTLQEIHPTGEPLAWVIPPGGSMGIPDGKACFNSVCLHPDKRKEPDADGKYPICEGTGAKI